MWRVQHAVEVRIDRFATSRKVREDRLFASITLVTLEAGDPVAHGFGSVGGAPLSDFRVEGRQVLVIETDSDLNAHAPRIPEASTDWYAIPLRALKKAALCAADRSACGP